VDQDWRILIEQKNELGIIAQSAPQVTGPTLPSTGNLLSCWNFLTAFCVEVANFPSIPPCPNREPYPTCIKARCSSVTFAPVEPSCSEGDLGLHIGVRGGGV
jgi:hypothetical protein